jgi:hypothetical protein
MSVPRCRLRVLMTHTARHVRRLLDSGWRAEEIARELGHTSRSVYKWLHEEMKPRPRAAKRLLRLKARKP